MVEVGRGQRIEEPPGLFHLAGRSQQDPRGAGESGSKTVHELQFLLEITGHAEYDRTRLARRFEVPIER